MLGAQERIAARLEKADFFTLLAPRRSVKGSPGRWPLGDAHVSSYTPVHGPPRFTSVSSYHARVNVIMSYRISVFRSYSSERISFELWKTHRALRTLLVEYQTRSATEPLKLPSDLAGSC